MDDLRNLLKLEAPLGVQSRPPHAGFFPLNKFSTVPLLMKSARTAVSDSNGDDAKKEFMILPDTTRFRCARHRLRRVRGESLVSTLATVSSSWRPEE